jgi:N-acyl homoserine lactone hydrolase
VTVELELIRCADSLVAPGWFYRPEAEGSLRRALGIGIPKDQRIPSPIGAYLLRHPERGPILIDTGLSRRAAEDLRADFGRLNARFFKTVKTTPEETLAAQLTRRGVAPELIELVVMTHLHVDHTSGMAELPAAQFVCSASEWRAANARLAVLSGYVRRQLPAESRMRLIDFEAEGVPHGPFSASVDLLGDGTIRLISTAGHTPGHLSVLVRLAEREPLVIADAVYTLRNLREEILPVRTDDELYRQSLHEIGQYAARAPEALLIPTHDEEIGVSSPDPAYECTKRWALEANVSIFAISAYARITCSCARRNGRRGNFHGGSKRSSPSALVTRPPRTTSAVSPAPCLTPGFPGLAEARARPVEGG